MVALALVQIYFGVYGLYLDSYKVQRNWGLWVHPSPGRVPCLLPWRKSPSYWEPEEAETLIMNFATASAMGSLKKVCWARV